MKSCFGYVRVSTVKQGDGVSLEAQKDAILVYSAKNNIEISEWFEEKVTAAKIGRPVFTQMLRLLRKKSVDGVVLHKPDRAARNFADWAKIGDLADSGIDVHFASESLDFRSRGGRLSADIQAVIAADYIRNLKEEIHKGQHGQLTRGMYPFSAPLGYRNNGGGQLKTIDPIKGPLVKRVFELYASGGYSMRTLLIEMDRMELRTHAGKRVSKGSLEAILRNPFYTGVIRIMKHGTVFVGGHVPLISASIFERAQEVRLGKSGKKVTKHSHTYRGLFACEPCGKAMIGELQKGHIYYRCHTPSCPTKSVREEHIENAIIEVLNQVTLTDESITHLTERLSKWIADHASHSPASTYRMQIEQLKIRIERLTDALIDHLIDTETFNVRKEALLVEQVALQQKVTSDPVRAMTQGHIQKFLERMKNLSLNYKMVTKAEKRQLVENTTSNRMVSGKKLMVEASNWLREAQNIITVLLCEDDRTDSRSSHGVTKEQVEILLNCAHQDSFSKLEAIARPDSSSRGNLRSLRSSKGHFLRFPEEQ